MESLVALALRPPVRLSRLQLSDGANGRIITPAVVLRELDTQGLTSLSILIRGCEIGAPSVEPALARLTSLRQLHLETQMTAELQVPLQGYNSWSTWPWVTSEKTLQLCCKASPAWCSCQYMTSLYAYLVACWAVCRPTCRSWMCQWTPANQMSWWCQLVACHACNTLGCLMAGTAGETWILHGSKHGPS